MKKIKYYARRRVDGEEWESAMVARREYIACSRGEFLGVYRLEKVL